MRIGHLENDLHFKEEEGEGEDEGEKSKTEGLQNRRFHFEMEGGFEQKSGDIITDSKEVIG